MVVAILSTLNASCLTSVFARFVNPCLKAKIENLGKVANDAVFHRDLSKTVDDKEQESDEESETHDGTEDDDADELEVQLGEEVDELEQDMNNLLQRIRMWQRPDIP